MTDIRSTLALSALAIVAAVARPAHGHDDAHARHGAPKATMTEQTRFGIAGDPKRVSRTIHIDMSDEMRFLPAAIDVTAGETIRFRVRNAGRTMHELVLGTMDDLREHAATMRTSSGMHHDTPYIVHVKPGDTGELVWTFNRPGEFNYACLIPGHFESGMIGKAVVKARG